MTLKVNQRGARGTKASETRSQISSVCTAHTGALREEKRRYLDMRRCNALRWYAMLSREYDLPQAQIMNVISEMMLIYARSAQAHVGH